MYNPEKINNRNVLWAAGMTCASLFALFVDGEEKLQDFYKDRKDATSAAIGALHSPSPNLIRSLYMSKAFINIPFHSVPVAYFISPQ